MTTVINYPGSEADTPAATNAGSKPLDRPAPLIKVQDIAYVLFEKPDLGQQLEFLQDFGMQPAAQSEEAIFMRGCGSSPWFYAAYKGEKSRYLGMGLEAGSADDLQTISSASGVAVTAIDEAGGGQRVRLLDPDGFIVDIVYGRTAVARTESRTQLFAVNTPATKARVNARVSTVAEPSPLERLGHLVLAVTDFQVSADWYLRHLGLIPTDVQCVGDGSPVLAFTRCDRGSTPADHHTVVLVQNFAASCMHTAYETFDLDAVGQGSQYLYSKGWNHFWGIGRHILGSQIFDYWKDPFGDELEHYADGDMFDASFPTQYHPFDQGSLWAWGDEVPAGPKPGLMTILKLMFSKKGKAMPRGVLGQMRAALGIKPRPWMD
jgi:catechol 2,3-dioxygenase-like lactoylglutathione lyase family enzyme